MVFSMITGDMFTFAMIYTIILFGFSQAFFFMQKNKANPGAYESYHSTWVGLFHMTLGEYSVSTLLLGNCYILYTVSFSLMTCESPITKTWSL